jgi:hypothetical protein
MQHLSTLATAAAGQLDVLEQDSDMISVDGAQANQVVSSLHSTSGGYHWRAGGYQWRAGALFRVCFLVAPGRVQPLASEWNAGGVVNG